MNRKLVISSAMVVFLLVSVSMNSACGSELKTYNVKSADDPDGPLSGGLDDPSDFMALIFALIPLVFIGTPLKYLFSPETTLQFIGGLFMVPASTFNILTGFGEAFDLVDLDENGT